MRRIYALLILAVLILSLAFPASVMAELSAGPSQESESTAESAGTGKPLIKSFTVTESGNGVYRAEWDISNVTETVYVRIYAAESRDDFSGTEAAAIESGTHGSVDVTMPDIDSGYYIFYISAANRSGVAGYRYSNDFFFYDNVNRKDALSGVNMCREENDLYVTWNGGGYACVVLYDSKTGELISRSDPDASPCVITLPKGHKGYLAGAASCEGGSLGRFEAVDLAKSESADAEIILPSQKVTKKSQAEIGVKADGAYSLKAYNNGTETECVSVSADRYTIELEEGSNDIIVLLTDAERRMKAAETVIESDTIAPELTLSGQTDDIRTVDEEITLKGYVDDGTVLKYLGEEVDLAGGYFYLNKPLGFGKNTFTLVASDPAGNVTEKTINVERVFWSQKNILVILFVIAVVAITVIEFVLLFFRSDRKRKAPAPEQAKKPERVKGSGKVKLTERTERAKAPARKTGEDPEEDAYEVAKGEDDETEE